MAGKGCSEESREMLLLAAQEQVLKMKSIEPGACNTTQDPEETVTLGVSCRQVPHTMAVARWLKKCCAE